MKKDWWKEAVVYEIYPRSFMDSNGDGIGDLQGIISKLDYLKELGVDALWITPVYKSPQDDNGYDIADYMSIDPMFGGLSDMEELIAKAKERGICVLMDLVLNHSSDEHIWFQEAKKSRDNRYHDYYVWVDGEEGHPPNELCSCFGGSAWEWVPELKQYYLHQFSVKQPDLNWENKNMRYEIYRMINWWIDKGVGGFRLDVIDLIGKEPLKGITGNGPHLHEYIREMNARTFGGKNLLTVGETWGATPETAKIFSNLDGDEFSMVFQFEHSLLDQQEGKEKWDLKPLDFVKLKKILSKWQTELSDNGWNSLFWNNHDLPRIVSRWGNDDTYREESAKMLATLLYFMKGTPFIYQGEELAMTNVKYPIEEYRDIELLNLYRERLEKGYPKEEILQSIYTKGRDNARTPMQWNASPNGGFTTGTPWIKVNPNYTEINAEEQLQRSGSVLNYYKALIHLRKQLKSICRGDYELLLPEHKQLFAYVRCSEGEKVIVICNFTASEIDDDWYCKVFREEKEGEYELLLSNYEKGNVELKPYEARVYRKRTAD